MGPKDFRVPEKLMMKILFISSSSCLSLILAVICQAAVPSSPDQALDTLDLLREETLTICEMGDRKSVVSGKSVDLGGRRIIKKKKTSISIAVVCYLAIYVC